MSCENLASKCKQGYKGVENFLRRIAFNLGNTPSQTEVKIISCIPIDVTDLQQKIKLLEKELVLARGKNQPVVQNLYYRNKNSSSLNTTQKSNENCQTAGIELCEGACLKRSQSLNSQATLFDKTISENLPPCVCWSSELSAAHTDVPEPKRGLFGRIKKNKTPKKKDKGKTQLVYYTQTDNNPFAYANTPFQETKKKKNTGTDGVSQTYTTKMLRKQYTATPSAKEYSITNKFSSPVCCDTNLYAENCREPTQNNFDLCSCTHGNFHNIDEYVRKHKTQYSYDFNQTTDFYDSSLYDLVPVKEVPQKIRVHINESIKKKPKNGKENTHSPDRCQQRYRCDPIIVNCKKNSDAPLNYSRKPLKLADSREKYQRYHKAQNFIDRNCQRSSSNSCCIDCGDVYSKRANADIKTQPVLKSIISVTQKNAGCLTTCMNNIQCQTNTTQSVQIGKDLLDDSKTEETLDQIKSILQTVLTEVKTNAETKKVIVEKPTKDAVVQKDISQRNMPGCSSLLHSYTYSSHNINPNLTSCSPQNNSGACFPTAPYGFGMMPGKYIHNFPVFIHTPGRNMCTSCNRNGPKTNHMCTQKKAATAATNTDKKEYTKETEKLIKEIYKSIAANMQTAAKETSASEYEDLKSIITRQSLNKALSRSESSKTASSNKFLREGLLNREFASNTLSLRSQIISSTHRGQLSRNRRKDSDLDNSQTQKTRQNYIIEEDYEETTPSTSEDEETILTDDNAECYVTLSDKDAKKPEKNSVFGKMFKRSMKLFGRKNKKKVERKQIEIGVEADDSEEDSDDYETVYSVRDPNQESTRHMAYLNRNQVMKTRTTYPEANLGSNRMKSPYMEQEYRRYWDEKLMFQKHNQKAPSEVYSRSPYWQNYEARSALISNSSEKNEISQVPQKMLSKPYAIQAKRNNRPKLNVKPKGISWLKKHKPGFKCGEQWKRFILEN